MREFLKDLFFVVLLSGFLLILLLTGCSGKQCIKVGGEYQGVIGDVEYCYDFGQSKNNGVPTLIGQDALLFGFTEEQIKDILKKIHSEKIRVLHIKKEKPIIELLNILKE